MLNDENVEEQAQVPTPTAETPETTPESKQESAGSAAPKPEITPEKRNITAFVRLRQERSALKREVAALREQLNAPKSTPPAQPSENGAEGGSEPENRPNASQVPVKKEPTSVVEADEEREAIDELSNELIGIPGATIAVLDAVENNPRLQRLYNIDPKIALREAKAAWLTKNGLSANTPTSNPKPVPTPSGSVGAPKDLSAIMSALDKAKPGTPEYSKLVKKLNELS